MHLPSNGTYMKKIFAGILILLFLPVASFAALPDGGDNGPGKRSDTNITGHVLNTGTGEHLPYATVVIKGTTIGMATDATGHYFLKNLPSGRFTLVASAVGFRTQEKEVELVAGKTIEVNFSLAEQAVGVDEIVVSATRNETNKKEAAIIVNVASGKLFDTTASTNLAEAMNYQSGLRVETTCGNCSAMQLRINGLEGQYSQVLLDNRPVFSSLAGVQGLEQIPVSMIERVEVIRGSGSALYGSNAIGGVVNVITREPLRNTLALSNITNILEGGKSDVNTFLNGSFVSDDHKAGAYLFGSLKNRQWYDHNDDGFSDIPELETQTVGFRSYYKTSPYSKITAEYHHIREDRRGGNNISEPVQNGDITEWQDSKIDAGSVGFDFSSRDYRHRGNLYASAQKIRRDSYFAAERDTENFGATKNLTFVAGAQYTYAMNRLWFLPAELTAGFEVNYDDLEDTFISLDRYIDQDSHTVGGFVQNEWKNEKWGILIGARLDKNSLMDDAVISPRATLRFSPGEWGGFRASYASGYRAPQAYNEDLHIDAVGGLLNVIELDPDLKPEYSHSLSASADLYHNFGRWQANLLVEGFYTILEDVFTLEKTGENAQGNHIYLRRNGSGAKVQGLNFEGKIGLPGKFDVQLGYTLQRSRYDEPEQWSDALTPQRKMFRAPNDYGYFTANYNVLKDLRASVFGVYTGSMLVQHTFEDVDTEKNTREFFELGLKLSYDLRLSPSVSVELTGGVKNLFDQYQKDLDYGAGKDAAYVYGPAMPRTYFFGVKFTL